MRTPRRHQRSPYLGLALLFISSICGCTLLNSGRDLRELPDRDAALRDSLINAENADTEASDETAEDDEAPEAILLPGAALNAQAWSEPTAQWGPLSAGMRADSAG